jgi:hypothetical protein
VWILVAAGLGLGQVYAVGRHNAQSSLQVSMTQMEQSPATLYAVDVPELLFTFYLDRPVTLLPSYGDFERRVPSGRAAYLLIAPRALPTGSTAAREIGTDSSGWTLHRDRRPPSRHQNPVEARRTWQMHLTVRPAPRIRLIG